MQPVWNYSSQKVVKNSIVHPEACAQIDECPGDIDACAFLSGVVNIKFFLLSEFKIYTVFTTPKLSSLRPVSSS